jgi:SAM-dependent methyltransferase
MTELVYAGSELQLFAAARRWKRYWSSRVAPYVRGDVLDVGAGIGATIRTLAPCAPQARWTALEPDIDLFRQMQRTRDSGDLPREVRLVQGILADMPETARFDCILYIDVLEHIEDDLGELQRARNHLLPGGHLVVLAPAHNALYTPFDKAIGHFRRYNRRQLGALLPSGMQRVELRYLDSVGLIASAANRLLLRTAHPTPAQIATWDTLMVPLSRIIDPLTGGLLGKTLLMVARRDPAGQCDATGARQP